MPERGPAAVLTACEVVKSYPSRGAVWGRKGSRTVAVAGVSLAVAPGEIYGLVGSSGAGKSTLARLLVALERPDHGEVRFGGERVDTLAPRVPRRLRRVVQLVFQDPTSSLSPLLVVGSILDEPLAVHAMVPPHERLTRVLSLLDAVGLPADEGFLRRRPRELSGGERQRLAIARALACLPRVLVLDEPVASLDVSVRGQVLNLLLELRETLDLALVLIAHDLAVVAQVCDRVAVMLAGRIVEEGATASVLGRPLHPYTQALLEASRHEPASLRGDGRANGARASGGCGLVASCSRASEVCRQSPPLCEIEPGHSVACYFPRQPAGEGVE